MWLVGWIGWNMPQCNAFSLSVRYIRFLKKQIESSLLFFWWSAIFQYRTQLVGITVLVLSELMRSLASPHRSLSLRLNRALVVLDVILAAWSEILEVKQINTCNSPSKQLYTDLYPSPGFVYWSLSHNQLCMDPNPWFFRLIMF